MKALLNITILAKAAVLAALVCLGNNIAAQVYGGKDGGFSQPSFDGPVFAVAQDRNGYIWAGGYFNSVNGSAHTSTSSFNSTDTYVDLAVLDTNGAVNTAFTFSNYSSAFFPASHYDWADYYVSAIVCDPQYGTFVAYSDRNDVNAMIARFTPLTGGVGGTGATWQLDTNFSANTFNKAGNIYSMAIADGTLYVAGDIHNGNGYSSPLGKFDMQGNLDTSFNSTSVTGYGAVYQVRYRPPGAAIVNGNPVSWPSGLLLAGDFGTAALNRDSALDVLYPGAGGSTTCVAERDRGAQAACSSENGGLFGGGAYVPIIVNPSGLRWAGYNECELHEYGGVANAANPINFSPYTNSPLDKGSQVSRVEALPGGDVLMAGPFTRVAGTYVNNYVHILADGTVDQHFANGSDILPVDMALQSDGKVLLAGLGGTTTSAFVGVSGFVERHTPVPTTSAGITWQPDDQSAYLGDPASFSAGATGYPGVEIQWYKNGLAIPGATNGTLTINAVTTNDIGSYSMEATAESLCSSISVMSINAVLSIEPPPPAPGNDNFAAAFTLNGVSDEGISTIRSATMEPGEVDSTGADAGRTVWWTWTAPETGTVILDFSASEIQTAAAIYTGSRLDALAFVTNGVDAQISFIATQGVAYSIQVGGAPPPDSLGTIDFTINETDFLPGQTSWRITVPDPLQSWYHAAVGPDKAVLVGTHGSVLLWTNETSWAMTSSGIDTNLDLSGICYGNGEYVVVGLGATIVTSTNGIDWTQSFAPIEADLSLWSVAYGNGAYVAVGDEGVILNSPDAITWSVQATNSGEYADSGLFGVTYGRGKFVVVGDDGTRLVSADGLDWSEGYMGADAYFNDVAFGNNRFVGVGEFGTAAESSSGTRWTDAQASTEQFDGITFGNGHFVAVTSEGSIYVGDDGLDWQEDVSPTTQDLWATGYLGNGQYILAGDGGVVLVNQLPRITQISLVPNNMIQIGLVGLSGTSVEIDATPSLDNPDWEPIVSGEIVNSTFSCTDANNGAAMFYRAVVR